MNNQVKSMRAIPLADLNEICRAENKGRKRHKKRIKKKYLRYSSLNKGE